MPPGAARSETRRPAIALISLAQSVKRFAGYSVRGSFYLMMNNATTSLLSFITTMLFAYLATKPTVGAYAYALSLATAAGVFSLPGMPPALTRAVARGHEGLLARMLRLQIAYGVLGTLALLPVAYWYWRAGNAPLAEILALTAICVPVLGNPTALACAFWRGRKRFDKEAQYAVLQQTMFCALIVPVLLFLRNEVLVVCSFFVASCLSGLTIFMLTWRHARPGAPDSESEHFGKHLTMMQVLSVVAGELDKIAIWYVLGPVAVATYVIASRPVAKINRIIPFNFLILPIVSEREFTPPLRKKILLLALLVLAGLFPLAAAFYVAAPFLFHLLFPGYGASVPYFRALLPVTAMGPANAFIRTALTGAKKTGMLYATSIATPLVKIALLLALVPPFGIWGALAATISGVTVALCMNFYFLLRAKPATSA